MKPRFDHLGFDGRTGPEDEVEAERHTMLRNAISRYACLLPDHTAPRLYQEMLGALSQGIHAYAGIHDWEELIDVFDPHLVTYQTLETSYRLTREHIEFANGVIQKVETPAAPARTVFRSGALRLEAKLILPHQSEYKGGLPVVPSYLVKCVEFDAVIVSDADAAGYGLSGRDAKLLYVACARALHELVLLWQGERLPLLPE